MYRPNGGFGYCTAITSSMWMRLLRFELRTLPLQMMSPKTLAPMPGCSCVLSGTWWQKSCGSPVRFATCARTPSPRLCVSLPNVIWIHLISFDIIWYHLIIQRIHSGNWRLKRCQKCQAWSWLDKSSFKAMKCRRLCLFFGIYRVYRGLWWLAWEMSSMGFQQFTTEVLCIPTFATFATFPGGNHSRLWHRFRLARLGRIAWKGWICFSLLSKCAHWRWHHLLRTKCSNLISNISKHLHLKAKGWGGIQRSAYVFNVHRSRTVIPSESERLSCINTAPVLQHLQLLPGHPRKRRIEGSKGGSNCPLSLHFCPASAGTTAYGLSSAWLVLVKLHIALVGLLYQTQPTKIKRTVFAKLSSLEVRYGSTSSERDPVRPCNFHTIVIRGWCSYKALSVEMYRPNGGFGYCTTQKCWFWLICPYAK